MNESRHHDACGVGFLADIGGPASHETVVIALGAAAAMAHRGARAADARTSDGGGILFEIPRELVAREVELRRIRVDPDAAAIAAVFLPTDPRRASALRLAIEAAARSAGAYPLFWRVPPVREEALGPHALATRPSYEQLIVDAGSGDRPERMRRVYDRIDRALAAYDDDAVCLVSASATSVVYKALLSCAELGEYFHDLTDPAVRSRFALFHQRFSTNTAPSWRLVQPFRHIAHNGEINTIAGNRAWLRARGVAVRPGSSDSHDLNIAVDAMLDAGYGIDDAVDLLLGACAGDDERLRAYYEAHLPTIEHWDGPAAVAFYHAGVLGAALDRSGFRPLRWCRTESGKIAAASEAGVADFGDDPIVERGRLGPGDRLLVRLNEREIVRPAQFRDERRLRGDFRERVRLWALGSTSAESDRALQPASQYDLRRFGFTREDERDVVGTMASGAGEPVSSMGDDAALACLSRLQPPAAYLRQRFAQVTNPPIDSLREPQVFDMRTYVGSGGIHGEIAPSISTVALDHAIVDERGFDVLCADPRLQRHDVALVLGNTPLARRIDAVAREAVEAVRSGATLIVLDDRGPGVAVPAVLAAGAVHQSLASAGLRMQSSIVVADGFSRDAHSIATVISAGANAVSPWLALRLARGAGEEDAFLGAVRSGLMKIMAKLGICTLRSYVGAQTFEALGLAREVVERCFPAMHAHVPSAGFAELEEDLRTWHAQASEQRGALTDLGLFRYRREGVRHAFDPLVIKQLRASALQGDYEAFQALSDAMERRTPVTIRDLLEIRQTGRAIEIAQVETQEQVISRFTTAAMSLGALSAEAHEAVARAANLAGARSNSGEGGEDQARYARVEGNARSAIKQVASARFGVGISYLESADEIEIKIAQGSKPGEGGQIPAGKVTAEIAKLRGASAGQALISPPPHHDIYSIEDLAQLIYDLRRGAPQARIAVKLVAQAGIGAIASGVAKAGADVIHVSGHDGGTGASPLGSIKHAGLPWELGLCEVHDALVSGGLRERVRLRVDGGFKNGRDVIVAALLGADQFGFGSALLVAMGCIYARQCHKNTCPVGIATQDAQLRAKFKGTAEQGATFFGFVARDVRRRMAALGIRSLDEVRGRRDLLARRAFGDPIFDTIDLSALLAPAPMQEVPAHRMPEEPPHVDDGVAVPWRSHEGAQPVVTLRPKDRAVGARIAYRYVRRRARGLDAPPVELAYRGTAGQSFGAFLTDGITLVLDGEANDYVGKSMEGGRIVVRAPGKAHEPAIGNTCFYGARGGDAFVRGSAGERLCVRNSGARVVVEGAGDHACEYMTAGAVAILGGTGRNLASGMTGGLLFVLTEGDDAPDLGPCGVELTRCSEDDPDLPQLSALLRAHVWLTDSPKARALLRTHAYAAGRFWKLAPALADRHRGSSAYAAQIR